jgi:hypothetical protein
MRINGQERSEVVVNDNFYEYGIKNMREKDVS